MGIHPRPENFTAGEWVERPPEPDKPSLSRRSSLTSVVAAALATAATAAPAPAAAAATAPATGVAAVGRRRRLCRHGRCRRRRGHSGAHRPSGPTKKPSTPARSHLDARHEALLALSPRDRVLASRFSAGLTPDLALEVAQAGGGRAWFDQQVRRAAPRRASKVADWWPELHQTPVQSWTEIENRTQTPSGLAKLVAVREMVRRVRSPHQVAEAMAEFWHHQLHVPSDGDRWAIWRADYTDVVRRRSLGRFSTLLASATIHPAMLSYLDADKSTKTHPNENLARELLELHTVGAGNYTEDDVKNCARLLTGFVLPVNESQTPGYDLAQHWTGPVQILGFSHANDSRDGRPAVAELLSYLALHPATARQVALRLAKAFVSDVPPEALVDRLAQKYAASGSAIVPVLRSLISSPAFAASEGAKLRDPVQDVIATYRSLKVTIPQPRTPRAGALEMYRQVYLLGLAPMAWPSPEGAPLETARWANSARALGSLRVHWDVATGGAAADDLIYRTARQWLPRLPLRMHQAVEVLSLELLASSTPPGLLELVCWITESRPNDLVTREHRLLGRDWNQVLGTLMDHPIRYYR